jgi:hypothetical protein
MAISLKKIAVNAPAVTQIFIENWKIHFIQIITVTKLTEIPA